MANDNKRAPLTIAIYNPALLKKDDLIRAFVARQPVLDRLLDDLRREVPGSAPQHQLIIGQRGHGKTTLLRRLAFAVEDDASLSANWQPLVFPEEQYNVSNLGDFWLNCVDALGDALDRAGDPEASRELDAKVAQVPPSGVERNHAALQLLLGEADRLGRRVLLLVDNLDIVLDRLQKDEEWEFRRIISHEARLHFLGASSRVLEAIYGHGRAFYEFFQIVELKGFDEIETFSTLRKLAEEAGNQRVLAVIEGQPARIKTLRLLTGGNPRTLLLLYRVLAQGMEGDVQHDLEQLLDEYTALYKARFEELPQQAQQVVDAMAIHWDPITAGDLARRMAPLSVNQVSAVLKRLEDFGIVEKTPWFGQKKAGFQIAERFFNIWYLMRSSRRVRQRLVWLVKFLETWFDREERDSLMNAGSSSANAADLTMTNRWLEAATILEQLAAGATNAISNEFLHSVVHTGHVEEAITILERTGANERWRPVYEALRAVRAGSSDFLYNIAPEVSVPARAILKRIAPERD